MSKISLSDLTSLQNENTAITRINSNMLILENAIENTLSRDGTSPNQMESDLDMNSNQILNLPTPIDDNDPIRKIDLDGIQGFSDLLDLNNAVNSSTASAATATAAAAAAAASALQVLQPPQGRLTLTTGVPITTIDAAGSTIVYYTSAIGSTVSIYNGTNFISSVFSELSMSLDNNTGHTGYHQGSRNFDCFVINDAGTIRLGTGPSWNVGAGGTDIARGTGAGSTAIQLTNGFWTNVNSIIIRFGSAAGNTVSVPVGRATYVGTIRTTADGTTEDTFAKRWIWNAYNQSPRLMSYNDPAGNTVYSSTTTRQVNANTSNQADFVLGLAGLTVSVKGMILAFTSTSTTRSVSVGLGLDSTVTASGLSPIFTIDNVYAKAEIATWDGIPGIGRHTVALLQAGAGADTQTWIGAQIVGTVWG